MKRHPKRLPAEQRRQQILTVATDLFARQGYQGTTTRQIAQKAKVNEAILFRHFPVKQDLYWAVIEEKCRVMIAGRSLGDQLSGVTDVRQALTAMATDVLERFGRDTSLMRLLLFSALEAHKLSERFFQSHIAGHYEELAKYLKKRIKAGEFRDVDPLLAARCFFGMINHFLLVQELFGGKQHHPYSHRRVAETLTDIWLEGMKSK